MAEETSTAVVEQTKEGEVMDEAKGSQVLEEILEENKAESKAKGEEATFAKQEVQITEEQKAFLKELEEEFKDRYTESDPEFKKVWESESSTPPIMDNWNSIAVKKRYNSLSSNHNRRDFKRHIYSAPPHHLHDYRG